MSSTKSTEPVKTGSWEVQEPWEAVLNKDQFLHHITFMAAQIFLKILDDNTFSQIAKKKPKE